MTYPTTPPSEWPEADIVRFLAVEIMGYKNGSIQYAGLDLWYIYRDEASGKDGCWNPLTPDGYNEIFGPGMLVEKMREKGFEHGVDAAEIGPHRAMFLRSGLPMVGGDAEADTAARAICLACVKAVLSEKEN